MTIQHSGSPKRGRGDSGRLGARQRVGLLLAGFVISAPLWGTSAAGAAAQTVTFTGHALFNLGTLACPSTPSASTASVTAGQTIDFVNRTGKPATLWAGDAQKDLPDMSMVPVTFTQGPATVLVQMLPKCSLDLGAHGQVTVDVKAAPVPAGAPAAAGSPSAGVAGGANGGTGKANTTHGSTNPPATAAPAAILGDPVSQNTPHGASGLLTLIATVGVVGVSAAAIRAIVAQRGTRALTT